MTLWFSHSLFPLFFSFFHSLIYSFRTFFSVTFCLSENCISYIWIIANFFSARLFLNIVFRNLFTFFYLFRSLPLKTKTEKNTQQLFQATSFHIHSKSSGEIIHLMLVEYYMPNFLSNSRYKWCLNMLLNNKFLAFAILSIHSTFIAHFKPILAKWCGLYKTSSWNFKYWNFQNSRRWAIVIEFVLLQRNSHWSHLAGLKKALDSIEIVSDFSL